LEKFRDTVVELKQKRFEMVLEALYLLFVVVILASIKKDSKINKNENSNKSSNILFMTLIAFVIYKIGISFIELNRLHKDIDFYFRMIS
jgi:glucose uptake protein GlcU